jgi:hypothetical protein
MERLAARLAKWANPRNAIIALALFGPNAYVLAQFDRPLAALAGGEPKLDLRFGYDLATVERLFEAYGPQGRALYVRDVLVDTPFPILGALAVSLFALLAFRQTRWRGLLLAPPLIFAVTDLIENVLLFALVQAYPALPPGLVAATSLITQVKRTAFYVSAVELLVSAVVWVVARQGRV